MNTIHDALRYGCLLASDEDYELAVTWNGGSTFNLWRIWDWVNVDVMTSNVDGFHEAERTAEEWLSEMIKDHENE